MTAVALCHKVSTQAAFKVFMIRSAFKPKPGKAQTTSNESRQSLELLYVRTKLFQETESHCKCFDKEFWSKAVALCQCLENASMAVLQDIRSVSICTHFIWESTWREFCQALSSEHVDIQALPSTTCRASANLVLISWKHCHARDQSPTLRHATKTSSRSLGLRASTHFRQCASVARTPQKPRFSSLKRLSTRLRSWKVCSPFAATIRIFHGAIWWASALKQIRGTNYDFSGCSHTLNQKSMNCVWFVPERREVHYSLPTTPDQLLYCGLISVLAGVGQNVIVHWTNGAWVSGLLGRNNDTTKFAWSRMSW